MSYAHHPHLFSREWFQLHRQWLATLKTYGPQLGLAALLACAALLIWSIYSALDMPLMDPAAMSALVEELFVPTGISSYHPPQF